jgi:uncharacterized protein
MQGDNPLDASAVHPEAYSVVSKVAQHNNTCINKLIGQSDLLTQLRPLDYVDQQFGLPTIKDILSELNKPGRDPRPEFVMAQFKEGISHMKDLYEGLQLEGVISNVTNFGAFVDIGVHQDGLVHISQLANRFVKDPREIVKAGDIVTVQVQSVNISRQRIALTMKLANTDKLSTVSKPIYAQNKSPKQVKLKQKQSTISSAMADAFLKARE